MTTDDSGSNTTGQPSGPLHADPWGGGTWMKEPAPERVDRKKRGYCQHLPTLAMRPEGNAGPTGGDQGC